jgi:hypothetical protein
MSLVKTPASAKQKLPMQQIAGKNGQTGAREMVSDTTIKYD